MGRVAVRGPKRVAKEALSAAHHEFLVGGVPLGLRLGERRRRGRRRQGTALVHPTTAATRIKTHDAGRRAGAGAVARPPEVAASQRADDDLKTKSEQRLSMMMSLKINAHKLQFFFIFLALI